MQTGPAKTGLTVEHSLIARTYGNSANHGSTINFTNYQGVELFHNVFIDNQTNIAEAINTCSGCTNTADFYGNVVWQQNAISLSSVLACVDSPEVCHWNAFNNTIANVTVGTAFFTTSSAGAGSTIVSYNNLFWNDTNGAGGGTTSDYNCYESSSVYPSETHSCVGGANYFTNSSTGDFHLASETPSNPNGFNTNSLLPANAQDPDGVNRSTADGGTWSRGAFEDPSQAQGLTPPSGLTAVVN
jgi:hypothetical protein